jgi:hypothetical protein
VSDHNEEVGYMHRRADRGRSGGLRKEVSAAWEAVQAFKVMCWQGGNPKYRVDSGIVWIIDEFEAERGRVRKALSKKSHQPKVMAATVPVANV